jgi:ABC-type transport system involved in multi-copper enzyme maturation permease subunit
MTPTVSEQPTYTMMPTGSWLAHTWRMTRWTLRLARRRLMSKILASILLGGFLILIAFLLLALVGLRAASSTQVGCQPTPSSINTPAPDSTPTSDQNPTPCTSTTPDQGQQGLAGADQAFAQLLTFPDNLAVIGGYTTFMGTILLCILAGALIGNEYSFGTQRLALSRGVSRAQLIVSQVWALALLALIVSGFMIWLAALFGLTIGPLVGGTLSVPSLADLGQLLLFWLALALDLLAYALIALLLATLGRSTAAGIAGSLGYITFEAVVLPILVLVAVGLGGTTGTTMITIYHSLLGPNLAVVLAGVEAALLHPSSSANATPGVSDIPLIQGLLVSLLYCAALIGLSYWLVRKRDVTH